MGHWACTAVIDLRNGAVGGAHSHPEASLASHLDLRSWSDVRRATSRIGPVQVLGESGGRRRGRCVFGVLFLGWLNMKTRLAVCHLCMPYIFTIHTLSTHGSHLVHPVERPCQGQSPDASEDLPSMGLIALEGGRREETT